MKKDKLEQYIIDHAAEFDNVSPPRDLWSKIEEQLPQEQKTISIFNYKTYLVAASLVLILGMGVIIGLMLNNNYQANDLNTRFVELNETESFYTKQVNYQLSKLQAMGLDDQEYKSDIDQLDAVYQELKEELKNVQDRNSEQILNALIYNHQAKINLLEKIRERLKDPNITKKSKINSNESFEI